MTKIIVAKTKYDCEDLLGKFLDESHYDILINEDTDCYLPFDCGMEQKGTCKTADCADCPDAQTKDEHRIAFKFRKNFFTEEQQKQAYEGLRDAAVQSQNRGLAAGPRGEKLQGRDWATVEQLELIKFLCKDNYSIDQKDINRIRALCKTKTENRGFVWLTSETEKHNFNFDAWLKAVLKKSPDQIKEEALWVKETFISDTTYANAVNSGIAGWFDRYPRIPYGRATSYTQNNFDKFKMAFPFLKTLNDAFEQLLPKRYTAQRVAANQIDSRFLVPETVFTTVTVNKTFRTAAHRDAGDFSDGLSNLLTLSNNGKYTGAYLVLPEVRIAIDVRPGDLLLVNNHECIHGNTPIECEEGSERISLVCYLREKMKDLGSYEYENLRYQFVESRRLNKEHELWKHFWNGISEGMWESQEWYDYLETNGGNDMRWGGRDKKQEQSSTLESLFG
jgi:hypothetical protein